MPTTSSPWASPSSPAGRRLLQSEPATADDIPVLDADLLALGAVLCAPTGAPTSAPTAAPVPVVHPRPSRRRAALAGVRRAPRRGLAVAAVVVSLLAVGTTVGLDRPAPAATAPTAVAEASSGPGLGRAAGVALAADRVAAGDVAVGLIAPIETVRSEARSTDASLARRLGTLMALEAEQLALG